VNLLTNMEILKIKQLDSWLAELGIPSANKVYEKLMKGNHIPFTEFSGLLGVSGKDAEKIATLCGEKNDKAQIIGFLGLTLAPTQHKIILRDKILFAWCAADTLLFPGFLSFSATIESIDPVSKQTVKLAINEDYLEWTDPVPLYISWVNKIDPRNIRESMCHRTHFFASEESATDWHKQNEDASILKVEDFFEGQLLYRGCC
jgi:alkylmercury lyase